jgi:hypothetical protein
MQHPINYTALIQLMRTIIEFVSSLNNSILTAACNLIGDARRSKPDYFV